MINTNLLRQSIDFQKFMDRVREFGKEAVQQNKTEIDPVRFHRNQGKQLLIDDIETLLEQIDVENDMESQNES